MRMEPACPDNRLSAAPRVPRWEFLERKPDPQSLNSSGICWFVCSLCFWAYVHVSQQGEVRPFKFSAAHGPRPWWALLALVVTGFEIQDGPVGRFTA